MGEACFYHPDRLCLVSCVCVPVRVCDWCGVLCCMSRWVIGLLIFPLAEHKSLFYPASLNLSRVKCLCSQLLTGPPVCLFFFFFCLFCLCVMQKYCSIFAEKVKASDCVKHSCIFLVMCRAEGMSAWQRRSQMHPWCRVQPEMLTPKEGF